MYTCYDDFFSPKSHVDFNNPLAFIFLIVCNAAFIWFLIWWTAKKYDKGEELSDTKGFFLIYGGLAAIALVAVLIDKGF